MALSAVATFVESLRRCELLPPAKLDEAAREGARLKDYRVLARNLLQRGWLTPFQANQLVQGRGAELVLGHYILLERLGEGVRGQVFKARHRIMNRVVCLNVIRKELLADPEAVAQFYREVQAASQLDHPNVVHAYDAGPVGPTHFLATEYVEGMDLHRLVKESGPLPVRQAAAFVIQAALGLQHASERGLTHRDIQPANLFITGLKKQGSGSAAVEGDLYAWGLLKILDFGLGRVLRFAGSNSARPTADDGLPGYLAPEQVARGQVVDGRADIYSLGGSLFYSLTGKEPSPDHPSASIAELRPDLPAEVIEVLELMRAERPEDRIQVPSEVADVLAGLLGFNLCGPVSIPAPTVEQDESTTEKLVDQGTVDADLADSGKASLSPTEAARERRLLIVAGIALLLGLAGFGTFWFYPRQQSGPEVPAPGGTPASDLGALIARVKSKQVDSTDLWQGFVDLGLRYPGTSEAREAREWLLRVPSPLDSLNTAKIPAEERYPAWQPKELVGVLGEQRWRRLGPGVRSVAYSPTGPVIASSGSGGAFLWDSATGRLLHVLRTGTVNAVAFAPDGLSLLTAGADKTVKLWQVSNGQMIVNFPGHAEQVTSVAFAADGQSFASGSNDKTVRIWDVRSRKERAQLKDHKGNVNAVAYAPDGKTLASASQDGTVKLWDSSGKVLRSLGGHKNGATAAAFAPKDALLVSGDGEGHIRFWDPGAGKELGAAKKHGGHVETLAFTADGLTLASGGNDGTVRFWDVAGRQEQHSFKAGSHVHSVAFAPGSQTAAVADSAPPLQFCDQKGKGLLQLKGHTSSLRGVSISPDCRTIATSSADSTIKLWDVATGAERCTLTGSQGNVEAVAFSADGQTLASAARDKLVRLWDPATGKSKGVLKGHTDGVMALAFSPDGQVLASGSLDKTVRLWDLGSGKERNVVTGATAGVTVVAYSPDGQTLAWGGNDRMVRLWDVPTQATKSVLKGHGGNLHGLAFSADGLMLASGGDDRMVRFWDAATGKDKGTLDAQTVVTGLAYTPNGQSLLATGDDGRCVVWKTAGRSRERDWLLPGSVQAVAAAADGRHVVFANSNGTAYILRLAVVLGE